MTGCPTGCVISHFHPVDDGDAVGSERTHRSAGSLGIFSVRGARHPPDPALHGHGRRALYSTSLYYGGEILAGLPNVDATSFLDTDLKFGMANVSRVMYTVLRSPLGSPRSAHQVRYVALFRVGAERS